MAATIDSKVLHVRFAGRSTDIALSELDVNPFAGDDDIKRALAAYFEVALDKLRDYVIDRHPTGNLTVRPQAVFG